MRKDQTTVREGVSGEAAQWFTLMQSGQVSGRERAQFCEWLEQSAGNVQEYLAVASVWKHLDATDAGKLSADELVTAAREDKEHRNIIELRGAGVGGEAGQRAPRPLLAIAASVSLLAIGVLTWVFVDRQVNGERHSTSIGEQKSFTLADGTIVRLNTQSRIRVRLRKGGRDISLLAGEAMFEVARDAHRPFRVHAGDTIAEAVGTAFNVYQAGDEVRITVLEGRVRVSADTVAELAPRERVVVGAAGKVISKDQADLEQTTAWTVRRLIFDAETLGDVVGEFNRYNEQRLEVDDLELAALRINGNFRATDPQSLVQFLQRTESVSAVPGEDGVTRLFRPKKEVR